MKETRYERGLRIERYLEKIARIVVAVGITVIIIAVIHLALQ